MIEEAEHNEEELIATIKAAGERLLSYWPGGQSQNELKIKQKSDGSYVTEADLASNDLLIGALKRLYPGEPIISEELVPEPIDADCQFWIIDPLDGTQAFIDGRDDFSILVARCRLNRPIFGVLYFPARKVLAVAKAGRGLFVNGHKQPVSTSVLARASSVYIRHFSPRASECVTTEWMDSGLAFMKVACGELDGVIMKLVQHKEWDLAAPTVAIEEAGGRVTDERGHPLLYTPGKFNYKYIVASNGKVHSELLELIPG